MYIAPGDSSGKRRSACDCSQQLIGISRRSALCGSPKRTFCGCRLRDWLKDAPRHVSVDNLTCGQETSCGLDVTPNKPGSQDSGLDKMMRTQYLPSMDLACETLPQHLRHSAGFDAGPRLSQDKIALCHDVACGQVRRRR